MSIYEKILDISKQVSNLQKDSNIKMRSGESYSIVLSEKVIEKLKPLLLEHKLIFFPSKIVQLIQTGSITTAGFEYTLADVETGEKITIASIGSGYDKMDKGAGKAMTYAHKKALIQAFNIKTSDDPDKIASDVALHEIEKLYNETVEEVANLYNNGKISAQLKNKLLVRLETIKNDPHRLQTAKEVINQYWRQNVSNPDIHKENNNPPEEGGKENNRIPPTEQRNQTDTNNNRGYDANIEIY